MTRMPLTVNSLDPHSSIVFYAQGAHYNYDSKEDILAHLRNCNEISVIELQLYFTTIYIQKTRAGLFPTFQAPHRTLPSIELYFGLPNQAL
jgi:hypothetical protein